MLRLAFLVVILFVAGQGLWATPDDLGARNAPFTSVPVRYAHVAGQPVTAEVAMGRGANWQRPACEINNGCRF